MLNTKDCILFSGAATGSEAEFGMTAEQYGVEEVNFTFEGHQVLRNRGIRVLNHEELDKGDVSLTYISKLMSRKYSRSSAFRKILQTIWYQINSSQEVYVVGTILEDNTVKGGTGWGAEFAKLCNKPLFVFDQEKDTWFHWEKEVWTPVTDPVVQHEHFCGTGTRYLEENGKKAIAALYERSFNKEL
jgi:hypothetical protein